MSPPKKNPSSRTNFIISLVFHTVAIGGIFFFAGREGMLGKRLKEITVSLAPKEKKPELPKKVEPKAEVPKPADAPKAPTAPPPTRTAAAPPPVSDAPPAAAPPAVALPAFVFNDGAKDVQSTSDVTELYKGLIERALRARWNRPDNIRDENFVAEIGLTLDQTGQITRWDWIKGSGNQPWDNSVKAALAQTKSINRPPPNGFPAKFVVRFDVDGAVPEAPVQLSAR